MTILVGFLFLFFSVFLEVAGRDPLHCFDNVVVVVVVVVMMGLGGKVTGGGDLGVGVGVGATVVVVVVVAMLGEVSRRELFVVAWSSFSSEEQSSSGYSQERGDEG